MEGCGELTNVAGTNGGKIKCGAILDSFGHKGQYYCGKCRREIKFNDGELLLDTETGNMTAIGKTAHELFFKIKRKDIFEIEKLIEVFDGINNCTIII